MKDAAAQLLAFGGLTLKFWEDLLLLLLCFVERISFGTKTWWICFDISAMYVI
jgi:hypothetical protein